MTRRPRVPAGGKESVGDVVGEPWTLRPQLVALKVPASHSGEMIWARLAYGFRSGAAAKSLYTFYLGYIYLL